MVEEKMVKDPFGKVFNKIGITGIAAAVLTIVFGFLIIVYPLTWEQVKFLIGLYLVLVGTINLTGYISSVISRKKGSKIYVETETIKMK